MGDCVFSRGGSSWYRGAMKDALTVYGQLFSGRVEKRSPEEILGTASGKLRDALDCSRGEGSGVFIGVAPLGKPLPVNRPKSDDFLDKFLEGLSQ
jgi:hypothetical protein